MKCYYEVLNIARDADDVEIKTAYKKLALRWHPDKNLDDPSGAKDQFQLVQQAYEVLIDRQERAWYDNHREQILHGSNKDYEDNCLDVFQFFTSSCYKGFGDDDKSFYTVYRNVFEQLAKEDMEHMDKDDFVKIPMFGTSSSDYESTARPFYAYWMSYSTKRSYVWLDPYDIKETRERRVAKLIEKENKKVRAKAKKERNDEVRNLVAFVRKRDKRVQANAKYLERKAKENKEKTEEFAKQARRERRAESGKEVQGAWSKFDNVQDELEVIEKQLAQEFDDHDSDSNEEDSEDDLYCVACNKLFKTPKAFANHESSKKHKENVGRLIEEMFEEEEHFESQVDEKEVVENEEGKTNGLKSESESELEEDFLSLSSGLEEIEEFRLIKKKNKNKNKKSLNIKSSDDEEMDLEDVEKLRKQKQKPKTPSKTNKKNVELDKPEENHNEATTKEENMEINGENDIVDIDSEIGSTSTNATKDEKETTKKTKRRKDKKTKIQLGKVDVVNIDIDIEHNCVTCKSNFSSKNKLFDHLKKTGHGVYIDKNNLSTSTSSNKKGKKGRRRGSSSD